MIYRLLLALLLLFCSPSWSSDSKYNIMTEKFFPFGYYDKQGNLTGVAVEIVDHLLTTLDIDSPINLYPWARAVRELDNYEHQVLFAMARTPERETKYRWVGPLVSDRVSLFQRANDPTPYLNLLDAKNASSITVTRGYPEHEFLLSNGFTNIRAASSPNLMVKLLMSKKTPLVVGGKAVIADLAKHDGYDPQAIKMTPIELFRVDLYIAMSKSTPDHEIARWQQALDTFKASPDYNALLRRYLFTNPE